MKCVLCSYAVTGMLLISWPMLGHAQDSSRSLDASGLSKVGLETYKRSSAFQSNAIQAKRKLAKQDCPRAKIFIGDVPFLCAHRDSFSKQVESIQLNFQKSMGYKQIYQSDSMFALPTTAVGLFNDEGQLIMLQFIFPANDANNSYKDIRLQLDRELGTHKRTVGYEQSPKFEYKWNGSDGVRVTFKRKKGSSRARLTYSIPHKAKAFLYKQGYRKAG